MSTIAYFDTNLTKQNTIFTNKETFSQTLGHFTNIITKVIYFTKHLLSVTEVQKYVKTFIKFINFDKEYTFRQNINNNRQNVYHS